MVSENLHVKRISMISSVEKSQLLDVDKFLHKKHYLSCYVGTFLWPWQETHFIKMSQCYNCRKRNSGRIRHIIIKNMSKNKIKYLMRLNEFWCKSCNYSTFYHYIPDECLCIK